MRLFHAVALFLPLFVCAAPSATAPQHLLLQPALAPVVTATNDSCVEQGWTPPELNGGSMLDLVSNGMREPINVILSGHSDPYILTLAGLRDFVRSVGFSFECFGQHIGQLQRADTGDGRGWKPEVVEFRQAGRWDPGRWIGTCRESLFGGNHFRGEAAIPLFPHMIADTRLIKRGSKMALWLRLTLGSSPSRSKR